MTNDLKILTDYEFGRIVAGSEWVCRGTKAVAECGVRKLGREHMQELLDDLRMAISVSDSGALGYVQSLGDHRHYGVFRFDWAIKAIAYLAEHDCPHWLKGLVFGYSPEAI